MPRTLSCSLELSCYLLRDCWGPLSTRRDKRRTRTMRGYRPGSMIRRRKRIPIITARETPDLTANLRFSYAGHRGDYFHLIVQPTGGVWLTGTSRPARTASNALRR
jgi:hypothetical protein